MVIKEEPQQLRKLLGRISLLLDRLSLRENHEIANYTGNLARKLVAFCLIGNLQVSTDLADAIVKHSLEKFQLKVELEPLKCKIKHLNFVKWLEKSLEKFKLLQKHSRRQPQLFEAEAV